MSKTVHKKDETPLIKCLHMSDAENEMSLLHDKLHNNSNMWPEKKKELEKGFQNNQWDSIRTRIVNIGYY